ncbi:MAG: hypothetical protein DMD52_01460 [Gemmatimonadetes bacterium]|nr:MAG: hypothetical protein DMD52_01460 [Gemmatimonadota bacterium]
MTSSRLFADRRVGRDRRSDPRRLFVATSAPERRRVVDRRRGAERRSTLDRRGRPTRAPTVEGPSEHIRNALQLLHQLAATRDVTDGPELGPESANILAAAIHRARRALELLEARGPERR